MGPRTLAALLSAALFAVSSAGALACTCLPPPPPLEMLAQSDLVVAGRVLHIAERPEDFELAVTLETHAVWKSPAILTTYQLITASNGGLCGFPFVVGEDYLVYANANGSGAYFTGICGRNTPWASAEGDLEALGPPLVVPAREAGFGMVKACFRSR